MSFVKLHKKPLKLIGFEQSSLTQGVFCQFYKERHKVDISIIEPDDFINLQNKNKFQYVVVFNLDIDLREKICQTIQQHNLDCPTWISDKASIPYSANIEDGVVITEFCSLQDNCHVKQHCILYPYVLIGHDTIVGTGTTLAPQSALAGHVTVGNFCKLGLKSSVLPRVKIANYTILGALSNATKDIEKERETHVGSIARKVK